MQAASFVVACGLAAMFVFSSLAKARDLDRFVSEMSGLNLPQWAQRPVLGVLVSVFEAALTVALLLLPGEAFRAALGLAALVLLGYSAVVIRAVRAGSEASCACFGAWSGDRVGRHTIVRNALLLAGAIFALLTSPPVGGIVWQVADRGSEAWYWLGGALLLVSGTAALFWKGRDAQPEALEAPPAGWVIPRRMEMVDRTGTVEALDEFVSRTQRPALLLFGSLDCFWCVDVLNRVPGWLEQLPDSVELMVLTSSSLDQLSEEHGIDPYAIRYVGKAVRRGLYVDGTPAALLLGRDGKVVVSPVYGTDAVCTLVEDTLAAAGATR